jgi:hypothetical protein
LARRPGQPIEIVDRLLELALHGRDLQTQALQRAHEPFVILDRNRRARRGSAQQVRRAAMHPLVFDADIGKAGMISERGA